ncbi:hypothetical protein D3C87_1625890 [compost metagenome]
MGQLLQVCALLRVGPGGSLLYSKAARYVYLGVEPVAARFAVVFLQRGGFQVYPLYGPVDSPVCKCIYFERYHRADLS